MAHTISGDAAQRTAEIRDIAADIFSVDPEEVESAESFVSDLDADSLLGIELVTQLEKCYDVAIPNQLVPKLMTNLASAYEVVAECAGW